MHDAWILSEDGITSHASVRAGRAVQDVGTGADTAESWPKTPLLAGRCEIAPPPFAVEFCRGVLCLMHGHSVETPSPVMQVAGVSRQYKMWGYVPIPLKAGLNTPTDRKV